MQFVQGFLLAFSIIIYLFITVYAFKHRSTPGANSLSWLMIATIIWSLGTYFELNATELSHKLFWRNFQQIGVFFVPTLTLHFVITYTLRRFAYKLRYVIFTFPILMNLLIFTNPYHHLMRSSYELIPSKFFGDTLVVHSTSFGSLCVGINFSIPFLAIFLLIQFRNSIGKRYKKQVTYIIISFLYTFFITALKSAYLESNGIFISMSILYIPSVLILFFSLFRYNYFNLTPIAYEKVYDVIDQGIIIIDNHLNIIDMNYIAENILAQQSTPISGMSATSVLQHAFNVSFEVLPKKKYTKAIELHSDNATTYIDLICHPLMASQALVVGTIIILNDVTTQKKYERFLIDRAHQDGLTGLLNRFGFDTATAELPLHESIHSLTAVIMDLDHFKRVNDKYGHISGDRVLIDFADCLQNYFEAHAIIARIGGEEFVLLFHNMPVQDIYVLAESFRKIIANQIVYSIQNEPISYTVSIGIATNTVSKNTPFQKKQLDSLLNEADTALYAAKKGTRNCTILYSDL